MAQWKETLEPYVKVIETVKQPPLNPSAGGELIIGAVIISDRGPSEPTLITSQKDFLSTYAAGELEKKYTDSLNELYEGDNKTLASTMWLNAYRLSGSSSMLITRAGKADGLEYVKPLSTSDINEYIVREGEVLRAVTGGFRFVLDTDEAAVNPGTTSESIDFVTTAKDGWAISVKDTGIFGNRVTDDGPVYDYYCDNLYDLVSKLNETTKFYIPACTFYSDKKGTTKVDDPEANKSSIVSVTLDTVFLAAGGVMEPEAVLANGKTEFWGYDSLGDHTTKWGDTDEHTNEADTDSTAVGCAYILPVTKDWDPENPETGVIDLNGTSYSGFTPVEHYISNKFNSRVDLKVRIRRFNHNAVLDKQMPEGSTDSPYTVQKAVLDVYTQTGTVEPSDSIKKYDFYEFAIYDPAISETTQLFNVGNVPGRGDITVADLLDNLTSIDLSLPEDLSELGLGYFGYEYPSTVTKTSEIEANAKIGEGAAGKALLKANNGDILKAWDKIELDERYIVEGLTDLGCTESVIQNYIANIAVNSNYFYAVSTAASTNYMVIANKKSKITKDSSKLYFLAPYDLDDGTVGYLFNASPSVIYWETVCRNRLNNQEFAAAFGQTRGVTSVVNLAKEFNKSERQLLLTKKINTIFHDVYLDRIYINDNFTAQTADDVMKEECNERLRIRISKAMPVLLNQFKGRQNNPITRGEVVSVIEYWFKFTVMAYGTTISDYRIICDESNNTPEDQRANKLNVKLDVRFLNSIKYITVYENAYPIGIEFED